MKPVTVIAQTKVLSLLKLKKQGKQNILYLSHYSAKSSVVCFVYVDSQISVLQDLSLKFDMIYCLPHSHFEILKCH